MTPSKACTDFIKKTEAYAKALPDGRCKAYLPTPNDVPTIGYGSTGPDITMGLIWTRQQAEERFAKDLAQFSSRVAAAIGSAPTTQGQFDGMVSLAYNVGVGALSGSTLLKKHKAGDYDGAAAQFALWNKQAGKVLNGLVTRRIGEARMYRGIAA